MQKSPKVKIFAKELLVEQLGKREKDILKEIEHARRMRNEWADRVHELEKELQGNTKNMLKVGKEIRKLEKELV